MKEINTFENRKQRTAYSQDFLADIRIKEKRIKNGLSQWCEEEKENSSEL